MTTSIFDLIRTPFGRLTLTAADGQIHASVTPVRAFPIQAAQHGIAMVDADGHEVAWIDSVDDLTPQVRNLVEEELNARQFMPEIERIVAVTSYATPCTWSVVTDRGATAFVLRGEENIRRLGPETLLISDTHGIQFLIRNLLELDLHSKKILDRFL